MDTKAAAGAASEGMGGKGEDCEDADWTETMAMDYHLCPASPQDGDFGFPCIPERRSPSSDGGCSTPVLIDNPNSSQALLHQDPASVAFSHGLLADCRTPFLPSWQPQPQPQPQQHGLFSCGRGTDEEVLQGGCLAHRGCTPTAPSGRFARLAGFT